MKPFDYRCHCILISRKLINNCPSILPSSYLIKEIIIKYSYTHFQYQLNVNFDNIRFLIETMPTKSMKIKIKYETLRLYMSLYFHMEHRYLFIHNRWFMNTILQLLLFAEKIILKKPMIAISLIEVTNNYLHT